MINASKFPSTLPCRLLPFALLLLASANIYAQQPMSISLSGVVPSVLLSANGSGQITAMPEHTVSGSITVSGLVPTMAHIHEGAVGKNGPPIITLTQTASDSFAVRAGVRLIDVHTSFTSGEL